MKKSLLIMLSLVVLAGCGPAEPLPVWKSAAFRHMELFKDSLLSGDEQRAEGSFARAVSEIKKSGDFSLLAKVYLTQCALRQALLLEADCGEYLRIERLDGSRGGDRAYFGFITGEVDALDCALLPEPYRGVCGALQAGVLADVNGELARIDDPLSRLIAAGIAVRRGLFDETTLRMAVELSSEKGWKKALLVYLGHLQRFYDGKGDRHKAAEIKEAIGYLGGDAS